MVGIRKTDSGWEVFVRLRIGDISHIQTAYPIPAGSTQLRIRMDALRYYFELVLNEEVIPLASAQTKYLSSEVAAGFTGVLLSLYAIGDNRAEFWDFACQYGK